MAKQTINIGTAPNDGTGTPLRTAFDYCNLNFTELYTAVGPSGNNIVVPGSATITGDLTVDTSTLKVDSANNRVGIGTASPGFALDIIGSSGLGVRIYESSTGNNNRLQITQEGTETRFNSTFSTGSAFYTWQIAGSTAMTLNSTGLGVGTVANRNLDVRQDQSAATTARIQNQSVNAAAYSELNLSASGNNWGIRSGSTAANSNRLEFVVDPSGTNLSVMRLDTSGNVGVGVTPSASWVTYKALEFDTGIVSGSSSMALNRNCYFDGVNWRYKVTTSFGIAQYQLSGNGNHIWNIASSGSAGAAINGGTGAWTQAMTLDASGNLLVGATSGTFHRVLKNAATGEPIMDWVNYGSNGAVAVCTVDRQTYASANAAACALRVGDCTGGSRSINASGSINANGADYAEYMTKAGDFTIEKGDVAGIDANGMLTNVFADAVSFVVKSTDPSYVGNDNWGTGIEGAEFEAARKLVDRIAFAGQVPVNVTGATAGDYIVPVVDGTGIKGISVSNPTFEQYKLAVGKVITIDADGRARIIVKVA
jgi:hypothetical protein